MKLKHVALLAALWLPALPIAQPDAVAQSSGLAGLFKPKAKFLPVHQAFDVSASQNGDTLTVKFGVTPEHYVYKDKLSLSLPEGVSASPWQFSQKPSMVDDPEFGKVAVFESDVVATAKLTATKHIQENARLTWQGCAKAGLCYPPESVSIAVSLEGSSSKPPVETTSTPEQHAPTTAPTQNSTTKKESASTEPTQNTNHTNTKDNQSTNTHGDAKERNTNNSTDKQAVVSDTHGGALTDVVVDAQTADLQPSTQVVLADNQKTHNDGVELGDHNVTGSTAVHYDLDHTPKDTSTAGTFGLDKNPILAVLLLFLAGIALAFTACVYPMIPIVANIVAKSHNPTAWRGFALTAAYGVGVATSYGLLGATVAWFGRSLGIVGWLQNPWILLGFAVFFVGLALQMWGVLRVSLPAFIKDRFAKGSQSADRHLGSVYGSFLVGALSALVVSPCVSAPLAGALWAVSVQGNVLLGFVALFALGLGLSLPLVLIGTTQGKFMPKAGKFMDDVKHFGGLMLLAVAILLVNRVFLTPWVLMLWAVWFMMMAVFLYRLGKLPFVAVSAISAIWSLLLMVGGALGSQDAWQPLSVLTAKDTPQKPDIHISTLSQLDDILATTPKVLVDVTADWCIECKIMEKTLFTNRPAALADWQVVKLDISQTTDNSRAVLARYELFGPPALLYYQEGRLIQKQLGEVSRSDFELALQIDH